jgi:hypothetical protein
MAKIQAVGTLEGVELTPAGSFTNEKGELQKYGNSISLQFSVYIDVEKAGIKSKAKRSFSVKRSCGDDELEALVKKYNLYIGKDVIVDIIPKDAQKFVLGNDIRENK